MMKTLLAMLIVGACAKSASADPFAAVNALIDKPRAGETLAKAQGRWRNGLNLLAALDGAHKSDYRFCYLSWVFNWRLGQLDESANQEQACALPLIKGTRGSGTAAAPDVRAKMLNTMSQEQRKASVSSAGQSISSATTTGGTLTVSVTNIEGKVKTLKVQSEDVRTKIAGWKGMPGRPSRIPADILQQLQGASTSLQTKGLEEAVVALRKSLKDIDQEATKLLVDADHPTTLDVPLAQ